MEQGLDESVNDAEETFTPSLPRLTAAEVELVLGNPGPTEDQLILTVLDITGRTIALLAKNVPTANPDQVLFVLPKGGIEVTRGETYQRN
jgi:hypothetical protein